MSLHQESRISDTTESHLAHGDIRESGTLEKVNNKHARWCLFLSLGLASYILSLDSCTTYLYLAFATSSLHNHALISAVQVTQSIILAVGKPLVAKFSNNTSRVTAYTVVLLHSVIGYIVIAVSRNVRTIIGGIALQTIGITGLQLMTQIVIADFTTLKWRGFVIAFISYGPLIINGFVGANIAASVMTHSSWRWGYGMFAILVPVTFFPLIAVLVRMERTSQRGGRIPALTMDRPSFTCRIVGLVDKMDLLGLVLLGIALSLVLLPLAISQTMRGGWHNASIITMIIVGCALVAIFGIWDTNFARHPIVTPRFLRNGSVVGVSLIAFFDFMSFHLTFAYFPSYILVIKNFSLVDSNYVSSSQAIALAISGLFAGSLLRVLRRCKATLMSGLLIRLLGVGLMIHNRGTDSPTVALVSAQVIHGLAGGFTATTTQVFVQASVLRDDVAMVTALFLLITEIGGAIGNAVAGTIWASTMPANLARFLPNTPDSVRDALFKSIVTVRSSPLGDPVREGVILAYKETMKVMLIVAAVIAAIPVLISCILPDRHLDDEQDVVRHANVAGDVAGELEQKTSRA